MQMSRDPRRPALPAGPERAPGTPRRRCAKRVGWRRGCASRRWKAAERREREESTLPTVPGLGKEQDSAWGVRGICLQLEAALRKRLDEPGGADARP